MENTIEMSAEESLRKLLQLKPVFSFDDLGRYFTPSQVMSTDLSFVVQDGKVEPSLLVPFLVSALQCLDKRIRVLESTCSGRDYEEHRS